MIQITSSIAIDEREIQEEFIRSSGPGGQNVNKVATAVQLRFDVVNSPSLPDEVRERLISLARSRITDNCEQQSGNTFFNMITVFRINNDTNSTNRKQVKEHD